MPGYEPYEGRNQKPWTESEQRRPYFLETNAQNLLFNSGDYILDELSLGKMVDDKKPEEVVFQQVVDLRDMYVQITLGQSINQVYMELTIVLGEGKQVFEHLGSKGLQGEEFVSINFHTPTRQKIKQIFYVAKYEAVTTQGENLGTQMVMRCVAKEKLINDLVSINRAYNTTISEAVYNVFSNSVLRHPQYNALKTGDLSSDGVERLWDRPILSFDDTYGIQQFIVPGWQPFTAIRWMQKRAFGGSEFPSSLYRFYQNSKAYNFSCIEKRIQQGIDADKEAGSRGENGIPSFSYDSTIQDEPRQSLRYFRNIQVMSSMQTTSTLQRMSDGTFGSMIRTVDPIRKRFYDTNFNMNESYTAKDFKTTGSTFNITDEFFNRFGVSPREHTIFRDILKPNEEFETWMGKKMAYSKLMRTYGYNIVVYGDSNLNIGELLKLNLVEPGAVEQREKSIYTGYYYITDLQHIMDRKKFNTVMKIVKDSPDHMPRDPE